MGYFQLDVTQIYFRKKDHALRHQWLALSNPEGKDFNEITAYLRVSVSVTGPGDDAVTLNDDGLDSLKNDGDNVMIPASIRKQYKQLHFKLLRG